MVIDIFTYNGEADILEIRLNVLYEHVDQFIIVEAPTTFSGKQKPLYFQEQKERFAPFLKKIKYFIIDENYSDEELAHAESSPNTKGAPHWKHEFLQKESIKKALVHLKDDDTCFLGDVDEIWNPNYIYPSDKLYKLRQKVYVYYLNNRSNEDWHGTLVTDYLSIKDECLNHLRISGSFSYLTHYSGWHFTSLAPELRRKLEDSYTEESYYTPWVKDNLDKNIAENRDFLGRSFTYKTEEHGLPKYITQNKEKYGHLFKKS